MPAKGRVWPQVHAGFNNRFSPTLRCEGIFLSLNDFISRHRQRLDVTGIQIVQCEMFHGNSRIKRSVSQSLTAGFDFLGK